MEQLGSHWMNFLCDVIFEFFFLKSVEKMRVLLKSNNNGAYFIWKPVYILTVFCVHCDSVLCTLWQCFVYTVTVFCVHCDSVLCTLWQCFVYTVTVFCVHCDRVLCTLWQSFVYIVTVFYVHCDSVLCTLWQCFVYIVTVFFWILLRMKNVSHHLIFAWPCIIDINNIDNQLYAIITVY